MNEFANVALGLLLLWVAFGTGILIWNNPFSYEEVREAERKDPHSPFPKD